MRSLLRIILSFHFAILFIILEVISFTIYINNNESHKSKVLNSSNTLVASFYNLNSKILEYFNLRKINYQLNQENAKLKGRLKSSYKFNEVNILDLYDSVYTKKYFYIPAKVINNSINKQHNYLTLNKGSKQGIKPEMAVVSPTGIVGIVREVSKNYSTVISILNTKLLISAKIRRNNYFGSLTWDGIDYSNMLLKEIPNHVERQVGDTIVTSGFSTIFPEGKLIGVISDFSNEKSGNFFDINVELTTDFKNLIYVYIIGNYDNYEQLKLEEKTIND